LRSLVHGMSGPWAARTVLRDRHVAEYLGNVKKIVELLICFLHPIAVVLIWIDLLTRRDIGAGAKLAWAIFVIVPLVPFLYVLTGGDLW
jgi:uncharacterized membrane protein YhaH (DUF805 family)